MAKFSVIVPVYNSEEYLAKCLDSILGQTLNDIEIIIVNDGSPDNSQKIIDEYVGKYPHIIKSFYQENAGQAIARNNALKYATGEFISFVDSDDYIEPEMLEKTYNYAIENDLDIVCFNMYEVKNCEKSKIFYRLFQDYPSDIKYVLNETSPCNKIIRRAIFVENNIKFTENRIYEDLELIPQLILYTKRVEFIDDYLYNYVIHPDSTMRQRKYNPKLASIFPVVDELKEKLSVKGYSAEAEYLYIEHLLHGAAIRYLEYPEGKKDIVRISDKIKSNFPHWRQNKYFKQMHWKYKVFCNLAYFKQICILKKILGV